MRTKGGIPLKNHDFNAPSHYEWVSMHASEPLTAGDIMQLQRAYDVAEQTGAHFTDMIHRIGASYIADGVTLAVLDGEDCTFAVVFGEGSCKWAERKLVP